jgi:hypothetical protein
MTETLRGGTWNMERDRDPEVAAREAFRIIDDHNLDFLCIQECSHYLKALRMESRAGRDDGGTHDLIAFNFEPGRAESAILVRRTLTHGKGYQVRATRAGWITVRGGTTPPKYLTTVLLDGWLRVVCLHTAPSVRWRQGRIVGPIRRVVSMRQLTRAVVRLARRRPEHPLFIAGDWNATPDTRGRWSPHWVGRMIGGRVIAPKLGTHGRRTIDFAVIRGCGAKATRAESYGSDHRAVVFKVTR